MAKATTNRTTVRHPNKAASLAQERTKHTPRLDRPSLMLIVLLAALVLLTAVYLTTLNTDFVLGLVYVFSLIFGFISLVAGSVIIVYSRRSLTRRGKRRVAPVSPSELENIVVRHSGELQLVQNLQAEFARMRREKPDFTDSDIRGMLLKLRREKKLSESTYQFALRFFLQSPREIHPHPSSSQEASGDTGPQPVGGVRP